MQKSNQFRDIFLECSTEKKLAFLSQLLEKDTELQQQFRGFLKDNSENLDKIIGEKIDDIKIEINTVLSELDFDNLDCNYDDNRYGYRDYWEVDYDTAIEEIQSNLEPYSKQAAQYLRKGNLLDAIRILLGVYEGIQNLPDLDSENCIFDGEYANEVKYLAKAIIDDNVKSIEKFVLSDHAVEEVLSLFFDRVLKYRNEISSDDSSISYNIKDFEAFFEKLTNNKNVARFLLTKIQEFNLESIDAAFVLLNIAEVSNDEVLWIKTAETYAAQDAEIAQRLLHKYRFKNQISDFNRIALMAFNTWSDRFDKYVVDHLDKEKQEELFVKALNHYVSKKQDLKYYHILKTYLSPQETLTFVDSFKDAYYSYFYIQLLNVEKRYKEILTCVEKNINSYELDKLIVPILNVYPKECFEMIIKVNEKAMKSYKRNRQTYQKMVETLKLLKKITTKRHETEIYLKELYNYKPNLPALKDEMRKANLAPEQGNDKKYIQISIDK